MARLQGHSQAAFIAMDHIRDTALKNFDSLFTPERNIWTLQNLQRFHVLFVDGFDEGTGSFLEKFRRQLQEADEDVLQLSAELLYVQQFFTTLTEQKAELIWNHSILPALADRFFDNSTELKQYSYQEVRSRAASDDSVQKSVHESGDEEDS